MTLTAPDSASEAPAFIATVREDHTVRLPESVPVGTKVAVVVMPTDTAAEAERQAHFHAVLLAIREAIAHGYDGSNALSDDEIARLVGEVRKRRRDTNR